MTRLYQFNTILDAASHREWELSRGHRTVDARILALLRELRLRRRIVALADNLAFDLSLTQTDLAKRPFPQLNECPLSAFAALMPQCRFPPEKQQ